MGWYTGQQPRSPPSLVLQQSSEVGQFTDMLYRWETTASRGERNAAQLSAAWVLISSLSSASHCHEPQRHPNWPTFTQLLEATALSRSRGTVVDGCLWEGQGPQSG